MKSLFDIQINGFAGVDFQQPELSVDAVRRAVEALAAHRTARFFATLITDSLEALCGKLAHLEGIRRRDEFVAEALCGYHLEGPWLSSELGYCGAHDPHRMRAPDVRDFERLQAAAGGRIRLVTLAPELPGSVGFIRELAGRGVRVSLGHTNANDAQIDGAIAAGARFCTHLGNAVPADLPRHDNIIQRLLARDELTAFFIPDGIHIPPHVLQNFFRAKPLGRALFTTDAMAAAGALPGRYRMAHLEVEVGADGIVRLPGTTCFAGSALTPDAGVENVRRWLGLEVREAERLYSTAVADEFGIVLPDIDTPEYESQAIHR